MTTSRSRMACVAASSSASSPFPNSRATSSLRISSRVPAPSRGTKTNCRMYRATSASARGRASPPVSPTRCIMAAVLIGFDSSFARCVRSAETSRIAVAMKLSSFGVHSKRISSPTRCIPISTSSRRTCQIASSWLRTWVKKPSVRNASISFSHISSAACAEGILKETGREVSSADFGWRSPLFPLPYRETSIGGATSVVTSVMRMPMPNTSGLRNPEERPMPATIRATSPRGTMPAPMRSAPMPLKPQKSAGIEQPTIFAAMESTV